MTDYATLTDAEINRRIAVHFGYYTEYQTRHNTYILREQNGERVLNDVKGHHEIEDNAWSDAPQWVTDVVEALYLIEGLVYKIAHALWSDEVKYWVSIDDDDYRQDKGQAMTLPRAICEAWLAWKEATHE